MMKFLMDWQLYWTQKESEVIELLKSYVACKEVIQEIELEDSKEFKSKCIECSKIKSEILRVSVKLYEEIIMK